MAEREELLTVEQVAEYLQVNPQTVRNGIDAGSIRATRLGARRVRIRESELHRFIAAGEPERVDAKQPLDTDLSAALIAAAYTAEPVELIARYEPSPLTHSDWLTRSSATTAERQRQAAAPSLPCA